MSVYKVRKHGEIGWGEISAQEAWSLIMRENDGRVTPTLVKLELGEHVWFEKYEMKVEKEE